MQEYGFPISVVGAIIEDNSSTEKKILVQERIDIKENNKINIKYHGTLEIPGGKVELGEDIFSALRREIKEECNLELTRVLCNKSNTYFNNGDVSEVFYPFCVSQFLEGPYFTFIFRCEATGKTKDTESAKNHRWISIPELEDILENNPKSIFTPFLGPLKIYIKSQD
ncbi:MAG: NUDIX domain-containing protein [Nanoarchaeota archaeon]